MAKIGIFYGSTEGNTEHVASRIQETLGADIADIHDVKSSSADDVNKYDILIFGCPTWEIGELQEDWESFIDVLDDVDFSNKKVALFGLGDADGYPDTFVDAIGIIYERIKDSGITLIGKWPSKDYHFDDSKALVGEDFLGLVIDEDNEANLTDERISKWVKQIQNEF